MHKVHGSKTNQMRGYPKHGKKNTQGVGQIREKFSYSESVTSRMLLQDTFF
uniref:Uncharacterized protein n=1 Tax=Rhizophora mucronata TaxID=61149 RepID=A0A2P2MZN1_RHIMU